MLDYGQRPFQPVRHNSAHAKASVRPSPPAGRRAKHPYPLYGSLSVVQYNPGGGVITGVLPRTRKLVDPARLQSFLRPYPFHKGGMAGPLGWASVSIPISIGYTFVPAAMFIDGIYD